jgi:hypothetical protein
MWFRLRSAPIGIREPLARTVTLAEWFLERLIRSNRRVLLYDIIVLGESHLRRSLRSYARGHNEISTMGSFRKPPRIVRFSVVS